MGLKYCKNIVSRGVWWCPPTILNRLRVHYLSFIISFALLEPITFNSKLILWTCILLFTDGQLQCACEGPKCLHPTRCQGTQCFSSVKVSKSGVFFERGCLDEPDQILLQCFTATSYHQAIQCCSQDRCNSNTTREYLMSLLPSGALCLQGNWTVL